MHKLLFTLLLCLCLMGPCVSQALAQDTTTRRRPDNPEFVTATQVRLTSENLTIAEVNTSTDPPQIQYSWLKMLQQSWEEFLLSLRRLFN